MWLAPFEPQRPPTVIEFAAPPDLVLGAALQGQPLPAPSCTSSQSTPGRRAAAHRDRRRRRRAGAVDDYFAAVTMISTSRPGKTSCGDTTHARTGALL